MPGICNGSNNTSEREDTPERDRRFGIPVHEQCREFSQNNSQNPDPAVGLTSEQEQLLTHYILSLTGPFRHLTLSEMQQIAFKFFEDRRIPTDFLAEMSGEQWFQDFLDKNPILYSRAEGTHENAASQNVDFDDPQEGSSNSYRNFDGETSTSANDTEVNSRDDPKVPDESASYTSL